MPTRDQEREIYNLNFIFTVGAQKNKADTYSAISFSHDFLLNHCHGLNRSFMIHKYIDIIQINYHVYIYIYFTHTHDIH